MLEIDSDILYENVCLLYTCHFVIFFLFLFDYRQSVTRYECGIMLFILLISVK